MSKLSKYGRRAKDQFRRELEEYQEDAIDSELERLTFWDDDLEDDWDEGDDLDDAYWDIYDDLDDDYWDIYDDHEEEEILSERFYWEYWDPDEQEVDQVGTYYKDDQRRTFLCCEFNGLIRYVNVHTGKVERVNLFQLEKVA